MENLKLFKVLQESKYNANERLKQDDIKIVIDDITDSGVAFLGEHAVLESARVCTRLLKDILQRLNKKQLQDVTYGEIPTIITELIAYMALKSNQQKQGVY